MFGRKTLLAGLAAATFGTGALAMPAAAAASTRVPVVYQYAWGDAHVRPHVLGYGATGNVLINFAVKQVGQPPRSLGPGLPPRYPGA